LLNTFRLEGDAAVGSKDFKVLSADSSCRSCYRDGQMWLSWFWFFAGVNYGFSIKIARLQNKAFDASIGNRIFYDFVNVKGMV
jgi:hypothetical protein